MFGLGGYGDPAVASIAPDDRPEVVLGKALARGVAALADALSPRRSSASRRSRSSRASPRSPASARCPPASSTRSRASSRARRRPSPSRSCSPRNEAVQAGARELRSTREQGLHQRRRDRRAARRALARLPLPDGVPNYVTPRGLAALEAEARRASSVARARWLARGRRRRLPTLGARRTRSRRAPGSSRSASAPPSSSRRRPACSRSSASARPCSHGATTAPSGASTSSASTRPPPRRASSRPPRATSPSRRRSHARSSASASATSPPCETPRGETELEVVAIEQRDHSSASRVATCSSVVAPPTASASISASWQASFCVLQRVSTHTLHAAGRAGAPRHQTHCTAWRRTCSPTRA